jgi:predicted transcriptional regulator
MTKGTDQNSTYISRTEFAAFAKVIQNTLNAMDAAIQEAFEHLAPFREGAAALEEVGTSLRNLEEAQTELKERVDKMEAQMESEASSESDKKASGYQKVMAIVAIAFLSVCAFLTTCVWGG